MRHSTSIPGNFTTMTPCFPDFAASARSLRRYVRSSRKVFAASFTSMISSSVEPSNGILPAPLFGWVLAS